MNLPLRVIGRLLASDELLMLGAHLDSCHSGTGATDNAAGSAVMMEAVRILRAPDRNPRKPVATSPAKPFAAD